MISHPDNPYVKLLVIFGRDDKDLVQAAKGIAQEISCSAVTALWWMR